MGKKFYLKLFFLQKHLHKNANIYVVIIVNIYCIYIRYYLTLQQFLRVKYCHYSHFEDDKPKALSG